MNNTVNLLTHTSTVATGSAAVNYQFGPPCDQIISYPSGVANFAATEGVTEYTRTLIRTWQREGRTLDEIAKSLRVSKTQVINVRDGTRGVGQRLERTIADLVHKGSIDALRKEARRFAPERQDVDSYPERASALRRLAGLLGPEVLLSVQEMKLRPGARHLTELEWIEECIEEQRRFDRSGMLESRAPSNKNR